MSTAAAGRAYAFCAGKRDLDSGIARACADYDVAMTPHDFVGCWALHLPEEYREIFIAALGQLLTLEQAAALHRHGPVSEGMPGNGRGDLALRSSDELFVGGEGPNAASPSDLQRPGAGSLHALLCNPRGGGGQELSLAPRPPARPHHRFRLRWRASGGHCDLRRYRRASGRMSLRRSRKASQGSFGATRRISAGP